MIKGSIHQDITIIHPLNIRAPKYKKQTQTELKEEIINNVIIVGNFDNGMSKYLEPNKCQLLYLLFHCLFSSA